MHLPKGIIQKESNKLKVSKANRGMNLEEDINITNKYYLDNNIAYIYKKPTPIQIVKIDIKTNIITKAFFKEKSTLDYNGLYKGKYIEFDCKECKNKSFPLNNIAPHQVKQLNDISNNGGIAFLIVAFTSINEVYLIKASTILEYIKNDKKRIDINDFRQKAYKIEYKLRARLDYLEVIRREYFEKEK